MPAAASSLYLAIPGRPVPKGRPRAANIKGRAVMYTPAATRNYEETVAALARATGVTFPPDTPLSLRVTVIVPRTKAEIKAIIKHRAWVDRYTPAVRGADLDNIFKSIADALQIAGVIPNDSAIVVMEACRLYASITSPDDPNEYRVIVHADTVS